MVVTLAIGRQTATVRAKPCRAAWCLAPAKVNLSLRILGRREDGYHLLESMLVPVSIYDRVEVTVTPGKARVTCRVAGPQRVPGGATNLAARAARALLAACDVRADVAIRVDKGIPAGAGLGGGSSDAAAVLRLLTHVLELRLTPRERIRLALDLGADVPFFLACRPSFAQGIGEVLEPVTKLPAMHLVVAIPPVRVQTAWAYAHALPKRLQRRVCPGDARATRRPARARLRLPSPEMRMADLYVNDFEPGVGAHYPAVRHLARRLVQLGATATVMSGSGSAVVGDFVTEPAAAEAARKIAQPDLAVAVRVLRGSPRLQLDGRSPSW